jgi:hypothetical protein
MKVFTFVIGVFVSAGLFNSGAYAQNYPWCAYYGGGMGGARNCGFSTYRQCMAALSGNGGFCTRNTQYVPWR